MVNWESGLTRFQVYTTNTTVVSVSMQLNRKMGYPESLGRFPQFMELPPEIILEVRHFILYTTAMQKYSPNKDPPPRPPSLPPPPLQNQQNIP